MSGKYCCGYSSFSAFCVSNYFGGNSIMMIKGHKYVIGEQVSFIIKNEFDHGALALFDMNDDLPDVSKGTRKEHAIKLATQKLCELFQGKMTPERRPISRRSIKEYVTKFVNAIQED